MKFFIEQINDEWFLSFDDNDCDSHDEGPFSSREEVIARMGAMMLAYSKGDLCIDLEELEPIKEPLEND